MPLYRMVLGQKEINGVLVTPGELFKADSVPQEWLVGEVLPHIPGSPSLGIPPRSAPCCVVVPEPPAGPLPCISCGGMVMPMVDVSCLHCGANPAWEVT